jgi:carbonic anhydrase
MPKPMTELSRLLEANHRYAVARAAVQGPRPSGHLAIVTCMDCRIDVFAALGLNLGEAHIIRNAGGRVTDDVMRSLALSSHVLGVSTVVLMQHTECGLAGKTNEDLKQATGADLDFMPIGDHEVALREDIEQVLSVSYLEPIRLVVGYVYDVKTGKVEELQRANRDS